MLGKKKSLPAGYVPVSEEPKGPKRLPSLRTVGLDIRCSNTNCDRAVADKTYPWRKLELFEELGHILIRRHPLSHL